MFHWLEQVKNVIQQVMPVVTVVMTIVTFLTARRIKKRQEEQKRLAEMPITIRIVSPKAGTHVCAYSPSRSTLSRSEVLGILGMECQGKFTLVNLSEVFTGGLFRQVLDGKLDALEIPATDEEIAQFRRDLS